jgi:hypothetical protein
MEVERIEGVAGVDFDAGVSFSVTILSSFDIDLRTSSGVEGPEATNSGIISATLVIVAYIGCGGDGGAFFGWK